MSALQHVWVPNHHFIQRNAARVAGVAAQVLIGQEENLAVAAERPLERALGIGGGADHASPFAAERLDGGGRVHVGDGGDAAAFVVSQAEVDELLPGVFHLRNLGHVGHRTAGVQVGQDDGLPRTRQYVGAFRHEVYAAEDDGADFGLRRHLRQAVGIAKAIGEAHDFIALIMMTKNDALAAQGSFGVRNAAVHGAIREYEIVFERAGYRFSNRCCSHFLSLPSVPAAQFRLDRNLTPWNGDVESWSAASVDPLPAVAGPTYGDVEAAS